MLQLVGGEIKLCHFPPGGPPNLIMGTAPEAVRTHGELDRLGQLRRLVVIVAEVGFESKTGKGAHDVSVSTVESNQAQRFSSWSSGVVVVNTRPRFHSIQSN